MTDQLAPARQLPAILAVGTIDGLMVVALTLSFATLVYSGGAAMHLTTGAALFLLGAALLNLLTARGTSLEGSIMVPQDSTSAVVTVTLAAVLPGVAAADRLGTVFVFTLIATAATGLVMFALGHFRLGKLVRFVPYPVIGGFLAGTGWLLVVGSADLVTGGFAWSGAAVAGLTAAALFAVTMVLVVRYRPKIFAFPDVVIGGVAVFYAALAVSGTSIDEARALGLLPGPASTSFEFSIAALGSVDWAPIAGHIGVFLTVPLIATLALLLNVTGLEIIGDSDFHLNRELRTVGGANLLASLTGTPAGYHALGFTALGYRVGVLSRGVSLIVGAVCLIAIVGGGFLVSLLPTPLVAGVLLMIGLSFLTDWLIDGRRQMTGPEYVLMLAIVAAVALLGFLAAVLLGMAAAVVLFVVAYSRLDLVRHVSNGNERRSALDRSPPAREVLASRATRSSWWSFRGISSSAPPEPWSNGPRRWSTPLPLSCLVIDLRRVHGMDSTGLASFIRLLRLARRHQFHLIFSDLPAHLGPALDRAASGTGIDVTTAGDLDGAIEMAEDHMLADQDVSADLSSLADIFGPDLWQKLEPHLARFEIAAGGRLTELGEGSVGLFLVDRGRIAADIPAGEGRWQRVVSSGPGTILGEISLYLSTGRTARLRAEEDSCVFTLDAGAIASLEEADPKAAAELHRRLATVLAKRLSASNETVRALLR